MNKRIYYAHSATGLPESQWQTLQNHAHAVGKLAAQFAQYFGMQEVACYTGQLHDLGKYSLEFDGRLRGGTRRVDHATAGAKIAAERWGKVGKMMAFCIAGHHAGLANGAGQGQNRSTLTERLSLPFGQGAQGIPVLDSIWQEEIRLPETLLLPKLKPNPHQGFCAAFLTRMLYSCLVDADFLDTEAFYARVENRCILRGGYPDLTTLNQQFKHFIQEFRHSSAQKLQQEKADSRQVELNRLRGDILDHAVAQAPQEPGLFTLTVPTGGGKTFTSMAFALEHAIRHEMQRVIYVIPFTSIIEQNAAEFRTAFGNLGEAAVLEHHSTFDDSKLKQANSKDKLRQASENWDMPVVVTTAVQFFESLFADRPSRCRKLHNITGSVIILDEAQMLPLPLLLPIMQAIQELAHNYHCSVVMCTATQPAIQAKHGFYRGFENVRELAPHPSELFTRLRRTTVQHIGVQRDADLIDKLTCHPQILIIVNNRRHARSLYDATTESLEGVFHLTTLMCAKHRSAMLAVIRQRLVSGSPCRVVATSLIEAGVDVDFPVVMRAETGLDSIVQAAGRCNREGKRLPENSWVWVFQAEEQWKAPAELAQQAGAMRAVVRRYKDDLISIGALESYFSEVYAQKGAELDGKSILKMHHDAAPSLDFPFQKIAAEFRMINNPMLPLLISFDAEANSLIEQLRHAEQIGGLLRQLQPYTIQIYESVLIALYKENRIEVVNEARFGRQFYCLSDADLYDSVAGFKWECEGFLKAERLVI